MEYNINFKSGDQQPKTNKRVIGIFTNDDIQPNICYYNYKKEWRILTQDGWGFSTKQPIAWTELKNFRELS